MATEDRDAVAALARRAKGGVISLADAAAALGIPRARAAVRLGHLARRGWVQRLRRGLYLIRPLEAAINQVAIPEDPWVLARELFSPCYIGGWSAAEHWALTEQLFRSTLVVTAAHTRSTEVRLGGHSFRVFRISPSRMSSGVVAVWRGPERVDVSGLERTVLDALRNPELVGGGRHLIQILRAYGDHEQHDFQRLLDVAASVASGAAWKRLGLLAERLWPEQRLVAEAALQHRTTGYVRLDPGVQQRGRLSKRWRLWVNITAAELATPPATS